jgi:hypothetical protein
LIPKFSVADGAVAVAWEAVVQRKLWTYTYREGVLMLLY